jgi:hypothetical protein
MSMKTHMVVPTLACHDWPTFQGSGVCLGLLQTRKGPPCAPAT